jgi:hypothetical protein
MPSATLTLISYTNYHRACSSPRSPRARPIATSHPPTAHYDDTDEQSGDDEEDEDFSNSEISSDEEYSEEERSLQHPDTDFLRFGSSLQVKGIASVTIVLRGETDLFIRRHSNSRRRPVEKRWEKVH